MTQPVPRLPPWRYFEDLARTLQARHLVTRRAPPRPRPTRPPSAFDRVPPTLDADLPLDEAIEEILSLGGDVEVIDGTRPLGVVGLPELHGRVVRNYLRSGLDGLEWVLADIVRLAALPPGEWMPLLVAERWAALESVLRRHAASGLLIDPVEKLSLPDLLHILPAFKSLTGSRHFFYEHALGPRVPRVLALHASVVDAQADLPASRLELRELLGGISDVKVMGANALKYVSSPELKRRSRPVEATARR